MNDQVHRHLQWIEQRQHRQLRRLLTQDEWLKVCAEIQDPSKPMIERVTRRLELFLQMEQPVWMENTHIQGLRTIIEFPDVYCDDEMDNIKSRHYVHEKGKVTNIAYNYDTVLKEGLEGAAHVYVGLDTADERAKTYAVCVDRTLDAMLNFADAMHSCTKSMMTHSALNTTLCYPYGAKVWAIRCFRIIHFCLWAAATTTIL